MQLRLRRLAAIVLALSAIGAQVPPPTAMGSVTATVETSAALEAPGRRGPSVHALGRLSVRGPASRGPASRGPATLGPAAASSPSAAAAPGPGDPQAATVEAAAPDPVPAADSGRPAPTSVGFEGLGDTAGGSFSEPADSWLAVNAGFVGQVVNSGLRFSNRAGSALGTISIGDFFGFGTVIPGIDGWSGARLFWDAANGRWLLTVAAWDCNETLSKGYLFGAISRSADPVAGGWNGFWLDYTDTRGTSTPADDIGILPSSVAPGGSTDKVVLGIDELSLVNGQDCFGGSAFVTASLTVLDWASITLDPLADFPVGYFANGSVRNWQPAIQQPATSPTVHLLVETSRTSSTSNVGYATLTGRVTAGTAALSPVADLTASGAVAAWSDPPVPADPGGGIGSNVVRRGPTSVIVHDGRLAAVADQPCTPPGDTTTRACVRVTELDVTAGPAHRADVLFGATGTDTFNGGIAGSRGGALHVVYAQASGEVGISTWTRYRAADDPATAFSEPLRLASGGTTAYAGDDWGDSLGLAQDPVDGDAVWSGAPYAAADGGWSTLVGQVQVPGATFVPISPVRVLDSRFGDGLSGPFAANQPRTWQVAGIDGIPADAVAVTGNVTVTRQTAAGWVTVSPVPSTDASPSTINFPTSDDRANNITILLGPGGTLSAIYKAPAGRTTHLVFDVTGYFVASTIGATYRPVTPARSLDSRFGNGLSGMFVNAVPRTWQVAGRTGVPSNAVAVTGNVTVTQQQSAGYVAVTPSAVASPATSNLNFPVGDNRANGLTVALGPGGTLSAVFRGAPGAGAHLIFDVTGYYVADLGGARFVPIVPGRGLDSRFGIGLGGTFVSQSPRQLAVVPGVGIPSNATAITGNLTVVNQSWAGYVSLTQVVTASPPTSTLNFPGSDIRANGVTAPLGPGGTVGLVYIGGTATHSTDLILDVTGYFR